MKIVLCNIRNFTIVLLFALFANSCFAQDKTTYNSDSSIITTKDARLDELISKQKSQNLSKQTMYGFRIQIYFGGIRQKASELKLDFNSKFPEIPVYLTYQQPNFKVRVGDYRSRFEAQKFLKEVQSIYPATFIVPDDIKLPPLK